jgi:hypothetical protein
MHFKFVFFIVHMSEILKIQMNLLKILTAKNKL